MPYDARTLTDAALCFLDVAAYKALLGPLDSPLGSALRFALEESIRRAGERHAVEGTAVQRVARFLTDAGCEIANGNPHDIPLGFSPEVSVCGRKRSRERCPSSAVPVPSRKGARSESGIRKNCGLVSNS